MVLQFEQIHQKSSNHVDLTKTTRLRDWRTGMGKLLSLIPFFGASSPSRTSILHLITFFSSKNKRVPQRGQHQEKSYVHTTGVRQNKHKKKLCPGARKKNKKQEYLMSWTRVEKKNVFLLCWECCAALQNRNSMSASKYHELKMSFSSVNKNSLTNWILAHQWRCPFSFSFSSFLVFYLISDVLVVVLPVNPLPHLLHLNALG